MDRSPYSPDAVEEVADDRLPAYISNGVIGIRVPNVPWWGGFAVLNGLSGVHPSAAIECVPQVPYPLAGDIRLNGVLLSEAPDQAEAIEQRYDFACGELTSRFRFHAQGVTALLTVVTLASRTQPTVVLQETSVELDHPAPVELHAILSPGALPGTIARREQQVPGGDGATVDGTMRWCPFGDLSAAGIAYASEFVGDAEVERSFGDERVGALHTAYTFKARARRRYRLRQYASLVPQRVHNDPDRQATRLLALAVRQGFETLRHANADAWRELWKSRIVLLGADERWQRLADAAFFYLNTSVHSSSLASTNILGLAQWGDYHYYYGHVMWDIEKFAFPAVLLSQPHAARALLDFRTRSLDAARCNALQWG